MTPALARTPVIGTGYRVSERYQRDHRSRDSIASDLRLPDDVPQRFLEAHQAYPDAR